MGEVEVFQRDRADIPGVGNLHLVLVALNIAVFVGVIAGARLGAVSGLRGDGFRKDVLLFKQQLQNAAHFVNRPFAALEGGDHGDEHIGIVFDLVQIKMVLVVVVSAFVAIQIRPQFVLHGAVGGFRRQHIRVLQRVGRGNDTGYPALKQRGAGGDAGHEQQYRGGDAAYDEEAFFVPDKEAAGLFCILGGASCRLCRDLGRLRGVLCTASRFCGGVFLFNGTLLLPAGVGIGSPAVFLFVLFVQRL